MYQQKDVTFLFMYPVRNLLMVMIEGSSIYEGNKRYKLPLPDYIDLDFVLKNEFFVNKIRLILKSRNKRNEVLFELLLAICIYLENNSDVYKGIILDKIKLYKQHVRDFLIDGFVDFNEEIKLAYDELYDKFETDFFRDFLSTEEFDDIKIDYCSS